MAIIAFAQVAMAIIAFAQVAMAIKKENGFSPLSSNKPIDV